MAQSKILLGLRVVIADAPALVLLGSAATAAQTLLIREVLAGCAGNELALGVCFAAWFLGIGLAAALGRSIRADPALLVPGLALVALFELFPARLLRPLLHVAPGQYVAAGPLALGALVVLALPGALLGLGFVNLAGLRSERAGALHDPVSRAFALESLGSLISGALLSLWLIGRVDPFSLLLILSGLGLLAVLPISQPGMRRTYRAAAGIALLVAALFGAGRHLDLRTNRARLAAAAPGLAPLRFVESPYQQLALAESAGQYVLFGSGSILAAFPDPHLAALKIHPALCQIEQPRRVLLLGATTTDEINAALRHDVQVDALDLDPLARGLMEDVQPVNERSNRVRLIVNDPRSYISANGPEYDVIVSNLPDPSNLMLNRMFTLEFFEQAGARLSPDGVLAVSMQSAENYLSAEVGAYEGVVFQALSAAFERVLISPGERVTFYATNGDAASEDPAVLERRFRERGIDDPWFDALLLRDLFPTERIAQHRAALLALAPERPNLDRRPIAAYRNLMLWDRYAGGGLAAPLGRLARAGPLTLGLPLLLLGLIAALAIALSPGRQRRLSRACGLAVASTGACGMAAYLLLISAFQCRFGSLYQQIGLFTAVFMVGLALGSWLGRSLTRRLRLSGPAWGLTAELLVWLMLGVVGAAGSADLALGRGWWYGLTALAGAVTGFGYPAIAAMLGRTDPRSSASLLESADHLGALLGSLLCGVLLLPLAGFAGAALAWWLFKLPVTVLILLMFLSFKKDREQA